jgi:hypothetical protein
MSQKTGFNVAVMKTIGSAASQEEKGSNPRRHRRQIQSDIILDERCPVAATDTGHLVDASASKLLSAFAAPEKGKTGEISPLTLFKRENGVLQRRVPPRRMAKSQVSPATVQLS